MTTTVPRPPHFLEICNALRRYGIPDTHVEDVAQDVYVTALDVWSQHGEPPKAWLVTVAFNVARNWRKTAGRRPGHDELCEDDAVTEASPEIGYIEAQRRAGVYDVIDTLPDDRREVFLLTEIEGFSMREIAVMLGVPLSKIQSLLRSAREAFWKETARRRVSGLLAVVPAVVSEPQPAVGALPPAGALKPPPSHLRRALELVGVSIASAALAAGITFVLMRDRTPPVAPKPDPTVLVSHMQPVAVPLDVQPDPALVAPAEPTQWPADATANGTVDAELILLERAENDYRDRNYSDALYLLNRHEDLYPGGALAATRQRLFTQVHEALAERRRMNRR